MSRVVVIGAECYGPCCRLSGFQGMAMMWMLLKQRPKPEEWPGHFDFDGISIERFLPLRVPHRSPDLRAYGRTGAFGQAEVA